MFPTIPTLPKDCRIQSLKFQASELGLSGQGRDRCGTRAVARGRRRLPAMMPSE